VRPDTELFSFILNSNPYFLKHEVVIFVEYMLQPKPATPIQRVFLTSNRKCYRRPAL
jgi:hypothetical protein